MKKRIIAMVGITAVAILAGCAKQDAAQSPAAEDEEDSVAAQGAPSAPPQPPVVDRTTAAAEMSALLDPSPQCQSYRDELAAKGQTRGTMDDMNEILVRAYQAGCGKKKQQQEQPQ